MFFLDTTLLISVNFPTYDQARKENMIRKKNIFNLTQLQWNYDMEL
jgi:hypothetical protein